MTEIKGKHIKELNETKKEVSGLAMVIEKACACLPMLKGLSRMERFCLAAGFSTERTAKLIAGERIEQNIAACSIRKNTNGTSKWHGCKGIGLGNRKSYSLHTL